MIHLDSQVLSYLRKNGIPPDHLISSYDDTVNKLIYFVLKLKFNSFPIKVYFKNKLIYFVSGDPPQRPTPCPPWKKTHPNPPYREGVITIAMVMFSAKEVLAPSLQGGLGWASF